MVMEINYVIPAMMTNIQVAVVGVVEKENNMEEEWRIVLGYEKYEVSSLGRIRCYRKTSKTYRILKPVPRDKNKPDDYLRIYMKGKFHTMHRLVADAFIMNPNPNKKFVNHKNGIKTDNRVENLEWCTRSENMQHSYNTGLHKTGKDHCQSKALHVLKDGHIVATLYGNKEWKEFGLDQASVNQCIRGLRSHHKGYTFKKE